MVRSIPSFRGELPIAGTLLLVLLAGALLYVVQQPDLYQPPITVQSSSPVIDYEVTTSDIDVDWSAGDGDFDPRDKCPPDFFQNGFVLLCKKLGNGAYAKFLYHKGKKLLYRIDKDVFGGKARIGLHWVESTQFNARYRIADPAYKGGRAVQTPTARGGAEVRTFHYGQAVSKKRVQYHRELFRETHISPKQCPEWWDIVNFMP